MPKDAPGGTAAPFVGFVAEGFAPDSSGSSSASRRFKQLLCLSCVRLALCLRAFHLKVRRTLRLYALVGVQHGARKLTPVVALLF